MVMMQTLALTLSLAAAPETVLLDFYSDHCPPCRQMAPVIAQFEAAGYPVKKINVTHQAGIAQQYGVTGVPCFVMVSRGREVGRLVGYQPANQLLGLYRRGGITPRREPQTSPTRKDSIAQGQSRTRNGNATRQNNDVRRDNAARLANDRRQERPAAVAATQRETSNSTARIERQLSLHERAMQASVRLKIDDGRGHSYGSGTIIDAQGGEALVLTCGHIFRDSSGRGKISVDLFDKDGNPTQSVQGQLIRHDLKRDIGLVAIRLPQTLSAMPIACAGHRSEPGDRVFSIGCDRGNPPTIRESRVSHVNKYLGPANIEVAGAPIDGRSGGGLFSHDGKLIGVCNAADPSDDEGLYAALETVHAELAAAHLSFIVEKGNQQLASGEPIRSRATVAPQTSSQIARPAAESLRTVPVNNRRATDDAEVILIVRSRSKPDQKGEVLFIERPSSKLLDVIASQRRMNVGPRPTSLQVVDPIPAGPVIRGQN